MLSNLEAKTNAELVAIYNGLVQPNHHLKNWKSSKSKIIERITTLAAQQGDADVVAETIPPDHHFNIDAHSDYIPKKSKLDFETHSTVPLKKTKPAKKTEAKAPPAKKTKEPAQVKDPEDTIRRYALELLCTVDYHEDKSKQPDKENQVSADHAQAGSVGLSYDEIIRRIHAKFPGCNTTVACLRWYAVKIRGQEAGYEGHRTPRRRPRAKAAKKG